MSFWLYHCENNHYTRLGPVKLTGEDGLLARYLLQHTSADTPYTWNLINKDLIPLIDPKLPADTHLIVLDMLPESLTEVSLHRVFAIQGSSEEDSSDVVLACKILYQGSPGSLGQTFKDDFSCEPPADNRQMLEALGLTGGIAGGRFRWSRPKMNIGATVCT
ncbi:hypothetical protein H5P28_01580 [Ruficoccus amylovorans]|uniref:Uncharacterized protein n=1 Tax=Ruficoccus amylovorans TaxID=1804625 RepID=A0A842H9E4_9BACT|nr:hypothetical protein [Ruficoccus amylovorans]MBC2592940.1 hypothetical protein [Ruficoccus amylovorans]